MDLGLKGKNALITGGGSGIGLGISRVLAGEGMNIAIASRNPPGEAIKEIEALGVKCIKINADLSHEEDCSRMAAEAVGAFGRLDAYINNAAWTWHQPVTKITSEAFGDTINTNLRACVLSCRDISKHMIENGGGNICIIGSTVRLFAAYSEASYRISKMGLSMYMETLAIELAPHNIRVNMITPGFFRTKMVAHISEEAVGDLIGMTPARRAGRPDEIGNAVAFVISDKVSGFTIGRDLIVDGGVTLNPLGRPGFDAIKAMNMQEEGVSEER